MTIQRLAHQPFTVNFRSPEGSPLVDTAVTVDGTVYSDVEYKHRIVKTVTDGAGQLTFYGKPGTVVTFGADVEPVQFVGVTERPGGLTAVHPETAPDVHDTSPVSEAVSDLSLVGAPVDGHIDNVMVREAAVEDTAGDVTVEEETPVEPVEEPPVDLEPSE